jgi:hypothetical protein
VSHLFALLGLTLGGRVVFSTVATLGAALVVVDIFASRPEPEAEGSQVAATLVVLTAVILVAVVVVDNVLRAVRDDVRRRRAQSGDATPF